MSRELVSKRNYALVTAAYWAFTLTDGALRMLVLLHFHEVGFSPVALAGLFTLYEVMGVVTNLTGGMIAARIGLKATLVAGVLLQVGALGMLSSLSSEWALGTQVSYVVLAQGVSGVAKDLTKLSAKSSVKLVLPPDTESGLFRWVALLTGSKNTLKGVGFFLGGALLQALGFVHGLWAMAGVLLPVGVVIWGALPGALGKAKRKPKWRKLFAKNPGVNWLSGSRVFLFGARDVWFVVALPVFLHEVVGWSFTQVGAYMAGWVIVYGIVQAVTPRLLHAAEASAASQRAAAVRWGAWLTASPFAIVACAAAGLELTLAVLVGLVVFGVLFAINSSLHSYLILSFADRDEVAADVGFYYMANALGRLLGTVLSGAVFGLWGIKACLLVAGCMLALSTLFAARLPSA